MSKNIERRLYVLNRLHKMYKEASEYQGRINYQRISKIKRYIDQSLMELSNEYEIISLSSMESLQYFEAIAEPLRKNYERRVNALLNRDFEQSYQLKEVEQKIIHDYLNTIGIPDDVFLFMYNGKIIRK